MGGRRALYRFARSLLPNLGYLRPDLHSEATENQGNLPCSRTY